MPLNTSLVGRRASPSDCKVEGRWLMAYAAGLGETDSLFFDTLRSEGVVAHPLFPVCAEWETGHARSLPEPSGLSRAESIRGVHYSHDLILQTPLSAGTYELCSEVVAVQRHRAGASMTRRIEATCDGKPAWTTWMTTLFRDVDVEGEDSVSDVAPRRPTIPDEIEADQFEHVNISRNAAHVYTECARIWNPIHTDAAVARGAGLPGPILHGTATLALAVSRVLAAAGRVAPTRVVRISGRFGAMVFMPSELSVRLLATDEKTLHFDVWTPDGKPAIRDGLVLLS